MTKSLNQAFIKAYSKEKAHEAQRLVDAQQPIIVDESFIVRFDTATCMVPPPHIAGGKPEQPSTVPSEIGPKQHRGTQVRAEIVATAETPVPSERLRDSIASQMFKASVWEDQQIDAYIGGFPMVAPTRSDAASIIAPKPHLSSAMASEVQRSVSATATGIADTRVAQSSVVGSSEPAPQKPIPILIPDAEEVLLSSIPFVRQPPHLPPARPVVENSSRKFVRQIPITETLAAAQAFEVPFADVPAANPLTPAIPAANSSAVERSHAEIKQPEKQAFPAAETGTLPARSAATEATGPQRREPEKQPAFEQADYDALAAAKDRMAANFVSKPLDVPRVAAWKSPAVEYSPVDPAHRTVITQAPDNNPQDQSSAHQPSHVLSSTAMPSLASPALPNNQDSQPNAALGQDPTGKPANTAAALFPTSHAETLEAVLEKSVTTSAVVSDKSAEAIPTRLSDSEPRFQARTPRGEIFRLDRPSYTELPASENRQTAVDSGDESSMIGFAFESGDNLAAAAGDEFRHHAEFEAEIEEHGLHSLDINFDPALDNAVSAIELIEESSAAIRSPFAGTSKSQATNQAARTAEVNLRKSKLRIFNPVWEVDHFQWPEVCLELLQQRADSMEQVAQNLIGACQEGLQVLAVTSSHSGEGRTTVACCLAKLAGNRGLNVAIVDCDIENPTLSYQTNLDVEQDWKTAIFNQLPLEEVAVHSIDDQVTLVPLLQPIKQSELAVDDNRISAMLQELSAAFDLVIVDMGHMSSTRSLVTSLGEQGIISAVVAVVDHRYANSRALEICLRRIRETGIASIGLVENFAA